MEADFQREYGINLSAELDTLSWRRFLVLIRGLGPNSATAVALRARRYAAPGRRDTAGVPVIRGAQNVRSALRSIFGHAPGAPEAPS